MGYSVVRIDDIEPSAPGPASASIAETLRQIVAGGEGCTMIAVGARRAGYEARGPY